MLGLVDQDWVSVDTLETRTNFIEMGPERNATDDSKHTLSIE